MFDFFVQAVKVAPMIFLVVILLVVITACLFDPNSKHTPSKGAVPNRTRTGDKTDRRDYE